MREPKRKREEQTPLWIIADLISNTGPASSGAQPVEEARAEVAAERKRERERKSRIHLQMILPFFSRPKTCDRYDDTLEQTAPTRTETGARQALASKRARAKEAKPKKKEFGPPATIERPIELIDLDYPHFRLVHKYTKLLIGWPPVRVQPCARC